jgi:hypothetical protein
MASSKTVRHLSRDLFLNGGIQVLCMAYQGSPVPASLASPSTVASWRRCYLKFLVEEGGIRGIPSRDYTMKIKHDRLIVCRPGSENLRPRSLPRAANHLASDTRVPSRDADIRARTKPSRQAPLLCGRPSRDRAKSSLYYSHIRFFPAQVVYSLSTYRKVSLSGDWPWTRVPLGLGWK